MPRTEPTVTLYCDNDEERELPGKFVVCGSCNGKGKRDYLGAITSDQFNEWHADEVDDYFAGRYDVTCRECEGLRVVVVLDRSRCSKADLTEYDEQREIDAEIRAEHEAERRFGC